MRVVLAEDLYLLRSGPQRLLEAPGFEVIAAVDNAAELLEALTQEKPDVAVIDIRLPSAFTDDGLRAAIGPAARSPACPSWFCPSTSSSCMPANC